MSIAEIAVVLLVAIAFISLSLFTKRLDPKKQPKDMPKYLRIFSLSAAVLLLVLIWLFAPGGSIYGKILLSILAAGSMYNSLKGWLFTSKEKKVTTTP